MNRIIRIFLLLMLLIPVAVPAQASPSEAGLSFACAAGDATHDSAVLWFRTKKASQLSVQYGLDPALLVAETIGPLATQKENDYTIQQAITSLHPGTVYYYRAAVTGSPPGPVCRFITAPRPVDRKTIRFAFGGDVRETYRPFQIMDAIRARQPDFFVFLGDTIYADYEGAATSRREYWAKYRTNRDDLPSQRLFSETGLYVIWDDHEVENNTSSTNPLMPAGRQAFFDYWPINRNRLEPGRLYRSYQWGQTAELFILDTRQYRDIGKGLLLGDPQKKWLLDALSSSKALFKFVATSVPISSNHHDKWGGFPVDRTAVLDHIVRHQIPGVVFLTADVHYAAVATIRDSGGLKEIIVGPLGTKLKNNVKKKSIFEFLHYSSFNYGLVTVNATASPPVAEIEILDQENKLLYKTLIPYRRPERE